MIFTSATIIAGMELADLAIWAASLDPETAMIKGLIKAVKGAR